MFLVLDGICFYHLKKARGRRNKGKKRHVDYKIMLIYFPDEGFAGDGVVKNLHANAGHIRDMGLIPGLGRSPAGGNGNPLHYSCLENLMNIGAWQATVHGVAKSWI